MMGIQARRALALAAILAACGRPTPPETMVGEAAPDFTLVESGGGPVRLADFAGRPVLL
jgi:hypothetical protein